jgi:hypothetical protein
MLKSVLLWLSIVVISILVFLGFYFDRFEISFSESQVNSTLSDSFPIEETKQFGTLTVENINLEFLETGQIRSTSNILLDGLGIAGSGTAVILSGLRYESGSFYLEDFEIESVELNDSGDVKAQDIKEQSNALFSKLKNKLSESLPNSNTDVITAGLVDRAKELTLIAFNKTLTNVPLYTLDTSDAKMKIAVLALKSVEVSDNSFSVILSPRLLLSKLFLFGFAIIISIAWMFVAFHHPSIFLGMLFFSN